jgi:hypothetical protein
VTPILDMKFISLYTSILFEFNLSLVISYKIYYKLCKTKTYRYKLSRELQNIPPVILREGNTKTIKLIKIKNRLKILIFNTFI